MAKPDLTPFEGLDVIGTTIAIRNAGDGLSAAMEVEPTELHHGETVHVVLECLVEKIRHDPVDKSRADGPQIRVHMLKAGRATMIDADTVTAALDAQQAKIDAAKGSPQLPGIADGSDRRGNGPEAAADVAGDVLDGLRADADRRGAVNEPTGADLLDECPNCHGPIEDGRCLLQECDIAEALAHEGDPPTTADENTDEPWEAPRYEVPTALANDAGALDAGAIAGANASELIAIAGGADPAERKWLAAAIWRVERAGKARKTALAGLAELADDAIPKSA